MRAFFDTNIVLYTLLTDDLIKADTAALRLSAGGVISVQVLNEMTAVLYGRKKWPWEKTRDALSAAKAILATADLTLQGQELAIEIAARYGYTIYDANILASAKLAGCDVLWSEDMRHGQVIDGVRIQNPFVDL